MENQKLGQEPAFPNENTAFCQPPDCYGLSKRFYAACAVMQGLVAHYGLAYSEQHAKESYKLADELLKQEKL